MNLAWTLRRGRRGLKRRLARTAGWVGSFALLGFLIGGARLCAERANAVSAHVGGSVHVIAYLRDDMDASRASVLGQLIKKVPGVDRTEFVDSAEALRRLRSATTELSTAAGLLESIEAGFLPRSIEITLSPDASFNDQGRKLADRIAAIPGVSEVDSMAGGVMRLRALAGVLRSLGWALLGLALVTGGVVLVIALGRDRRERVQRDAVLELLGESRVAIVGPRMLATGAVALVGGLVAIGCLYLGFTWVDATLQELTNAVSSDDTAGSAFLSLNEFAIGTVFLVLLGLLLGRLFSPRSQPRHA